MTGTLLQLSLVVGPGERATCLRYRRRWISQSRTLPCRLSVAPAGSRWLSFIWPPRCGRPAHPHRWCHPPRPGVSWPSV